MSKSVLHALYSVQKYLIDSLSVLFEVVEGVLGATQQRAELVAESQPGSGRREWAVALRFYIPRATVLVLLLG